jgi:hypothetical protein
VGINIRRDVGRARNEWQFIRIDRSLLRYKNKSISSQITAFGRPLCRSSTGECHLTGYLVCTNTLCSIIRSLYAAVSVLLQYSKRGIMRYDKSRVMILNVVKELNRYPREKAEKS